MFTGTSLTLSQNIWPIGNIVLNKSAITSWASFDQTAWWRSRSRESVSSESRSSDEEASRPRSGPRPRERFFSYKSYVAVKTKVLKIY